MLSNPHAGGKGGPSRILQAEVGSHSTILSRAGSDCTWMAGLLPDLLLWRTGCWRRPCLASHMRGAYLPLRQTMMPSHLRPASWPSGNCGKSRMMPSSSPCRWDSSMPLPHLCLVFVRGQQSGFSCINAFSKFECSNFYLLLGWLFWNLCPYRSMVAVRSWLLEHVSRPLLHPCFRSSKNWPFQIQLGRAGTGQAFLFCPLKCTRMTKV